jgi:DNA-binding CsgD family transcriptional regulator
MEVWNVGTECSDAGEVVSVGAVALLLDALDSPDPTQSFHAFLSHIAPIDFLTHVQYVRRRQGGLAAPELLAGHAAPEIRNTTAQCFAIYRERFWRQDECTSIAQKLSGEGNFIGAVHFTPDDVSAPPWRRDVYRRMQIGDRLSFLYSPAEGAVFGVNMYRTQRHGPFRRDEIERLTAVAALVRKIHASLLAAPVQRSSAVRRLETATRQLHQQFPELSEREVQVCARIACGVSADGIAAEFNLSGSTVATLRKRAYGKLRLHGIVPGRALLTEMAR